MAEETDSTVVMAEAEQNPYENAETESLIELDHVVPDSTPQPGTSDEGVMEAEPSTPERMEIEDEDSDLCNKCNKVGKAGIQWIQCNSCSCWLHRNCASLKAKKVWQKYSKPGTEFLVMNVNRQRL